MIRSNKFLFLFLLLTLLTISVKADDWPMEGHDLNHSGVSGDSIRPPLAQVWKFKIDSNFSSSPVVSNNSIFIGSDDGQIFAINVETGNLRWKYETGKNPIYSTPAINNGVVYVGSDDSYVYALDEKNGNMKWKYKTNGECNRFC